MKLALKLKTGGSSRSPAKYIQNIQNIEGIWCGYKKTNIQNKVKKWRRESSTCTVYSKLVQLKGKYTARYIQNIYKCGIGVILQCVFRIYMESVEKLKTGEKSHSCARLIGGSIWN